MIAHSGDKLLDRASICSTGTASGNIRMAVAFCFLGAKIYQRQEGQLNGEGKVQTGSRRRSCPSREDGRRVLIAGAGDRQKDTLCPTVVFDAEVRPA